jgi:hypothetical protein
MTCTIVRILLAIATILIGGAPVVETSTVAATTVSVRIDGDPQISSEMLDKLRERAAERGTMIVEQDTGYDIRVLVLARPPQWHQVFGIAASGAVAVLGPSGDLLFMHIRQKESSVGRAIDRMADQIVERLPALVRGEKVQ